MKKTFLRIGVVVMALVMLLSLVACSIPSDYKTARSNLRDNDYEVYVDDRNDVIDPNHETSCLLDIIVFWLEYDVFKDLEEEVEDLHPELAKIEKDLEKLLSAIDEDEENILIAMYFESTSSSREYYKLIKNIFETVKKEGVDKDYIDISKDDIIFGVNGKVVYFGTKQALDASR
ncbi:MAG: hypothetical protein IJF10_02350 [Clostridia bacterium]|nr:hypothetical protein [Clostridia bacterium]